MLYIDGINSEEYADKYWFDETKISYEDFRDLTFRESLPYLHRLGGPAYIGWEEEFLDHPDDDNRNNVIKEELFYIWGKEYSREEYQEAMNILESDGMVAFTLKYK